VPYCPDLLPDARSGDSKGIAERGELMSIAFRARFLDMLTDGYCRAVNRTSGFSVTGSRNSFAAAKEVVGGRAKHGHDTSTARGDT
jgi:hypothetical protein